MKLCIVGITGMVGQNLIKVVEERDFQYDELILVASVKSIGKKIKVKGKEYTIVSMEDAIKARPDIAIFSAGGSTSKEFAPKFAEVGTTVIDNSSAWRMFDDKKLIVPEVNGHLLTKTDKIIANPNCSTIQLMVVVAPLHKKFGIDRMVISTYQSVTGTGYAAVEQMMSERRGEKAEMVYPYPIDLNCFPHGGAFLENGYTEEEMKLLNESRKILGDNSIRVTATVVRIPVRGGHSEAVNIQFKKPVTAKEVRSILETAPGVVVQDDPAKKIYPMPKFSEGKDDTFVGRIRQDISNENSIDMWIVADNLRKGAATNAVQIAEYIVEKNLL